MTSNGETTTSRPQPPTRSPGARAVLATLSGTLVAVFACIALVSGAMSLVSYRSVTALVANAGMVQHTNDVLARVESLRTQLKDAETGQRGYLITGRDAYLAPYRQSVGSLVTVQDELRTLTSDNPRQQQRLADLRPLVASKLGELEETVDLRREKGFEAARDVVLTDRGKAVMDRIRALLSDVEQEETSLLARREADAAAAATVATRVIGVGFLLLVLGMTGVAVVLIRRIRGRMRRLQRAIAALTRGDLTVAAAVPGRDEFAVMGRDLDAAVVTLRGTMVELADSSLALARSASDLSGISEGLTRGAGDASSKALTASSAAEQVSAGVQTVTAGAEEMTASISEIAESAGKAAAVAHESLQVAQDTTRQIAELGAASFEIGGVVKLITSIAEQTNLLALNATIEAARAGTAGKGFAVVAAEVKDLAQATARATGDITARIEAIQARSGSAVEAVEQIRGIIGQISEYNTTVAAAVEEQSATTKDISRAITEAAGGSTEVSQVIGAVAEVADATVDAARASQQASENLSHLADRLTATVGTFRY